MATANLNLLNTQLPDNSYHQTKMSNEHVYLMQQSEK